MRGYLVKPEGPGPFHAVLVIHENRGLNPHIEDVACAPHLRVFGTGSGWAVLIWRHPGNDDDGRAMQ